MSNVNVTTDLVWTFATPGVHQVTLVPIDPNQNNANALPCMPDLKTIEICIEDTPVPAFQFDESGTLTNTLKACTPLTVVTKNQSSTIGGCSVPQYQWTLLNTTTNKSGFYSNNALFQDNTDSLSLEPKFRILDPGVYTLTLRVSNSCASLTTSRSFTVVGAPSISPFNYTSAYCDTVPKTINFNAHTYNANSAPAADVSYAWTVTGGDYEFTGGTSASSANPRIIFKSYGTYTISVLYNNGCGTATRSQNITFNQPLQVGLTANGNSTDISVCTGTPVNLQGLVTGPSGYTFQWTTQNTSGTLNNQGTLNPTYTPSQADDDKTLIFNLTVTYPSPKPATCTSPITRTIKVTYTATNTAANTSLNRCSGTAVNFQPVSNITNSEFIWTVTSAGPNITGATNQSTYTTGKINDLLTNSGTAPETVVYQITPRSPGGCAGTPFNLTVTVYPVLSGNQIGVDQTICANQTPAVLGQAPATTLAGGSGTFIYRWEQSTDQVNWSAAKGTANQATYQPPALTSDTYYRRTVYSPDTTTCALISNLIKITVNPLPDISLAAVNEICSTDATFSIPYTNTANTPTQFDLTTGTRIMPGFSNMLNVALGSSPIQISMPANVPAGTYDFNLKVRNANGCESTVKSFSLTVKAPPSPASAGADQVLCNTSSFILGANTPAVGTGLWTIVGSANGAVINSPASPSATVSGLQVGKSVTLRWTVTNGTCQPSTDDVMLTNVIPTPIASAGPDQSLCDTQTQATLAANVPSGGFVGTWTVVSTGHPSPPVFSPNANAPNASVSGLVPGNVYVLRWTIAGNSPCGDTFDEVQIAVRPVVTLSNAGADDKLCDQTSSNNFFNLNGNLDNTRPYENGLWTIIAQPSGSNATFNNSASPNATIQNLIPGTYRLSWQIRNDAGCSSNPDELVLTVYAKPVGGTITASTNQVCQGTNSGTLTLAAYTGDIEQWEFAASPAGPWTVISNTAATHTFSNLSQTTYYRARVVSKGAAAGCTALPAYSNTFMVTVNPTTVGGNTNVTVGSATVCQGTNSGTIGLTGQVGSILYWESSLNNGANWTQIPGTANQSTYAFSGLNQTTQFRAVVQSGVCSVANSSITTITVVALTQAQAADLEVCTATSVQLTGNAPAGGETGTWTQVSGPAATFANVNDPQTLVTLSGTGTYRFAWTIDNGICSPSTKTITVNNYQALVNQIQSATTTICSGQTANIFDQTHTGGTGVYAYQWLISADGVNWGSAISGQTAKDLSLTLTSTTYFKRLMVSGPCSSESNVIQITVQPPISNNSITQDQEVCIQKPVTLLNGSLPQGGDNTYLYQWQQSVDNGLNWTNIPGATQQSYQPSPLSQTTAYRRLVTTALCAGPQQSISNVVVVTVRPDAKADFSASKTVACAPFNLSGVISVVAYPDRNASYEWFANGVSIGTGSTFPGYVMNTDGLQVTIKLVTISRYGCENDEKSITFETVKSVTAGFTKDKAQGCGPLTVTFNNTSNPLSGAGYEWDFGNGQTSAAANPGSITFQPHPLNRDTTYIVKLRAYTDCQASTFIDSVLVRPQPVAQFTPDKTTGCSPLLVNFSNQSKGHPATYEFDFGDGTPVYSSTSLANVQHTFTVSALTVFTVTLKVTNECGVSTSSFNVRVQPNTVTANLVVNGSDLQSCPPHSLTFYNNSVGANQFTWDFDDGSPVVTNQASSMTHTFLRGGTYNVKLTATNGCSTTTDTETIRVYPVPNVGFTMAKSVYCKDELVIFQNTSETGDYLWNFGDGSTSTQANPTHRYTVAGTYTVMLTATVTQIDGTRCTKTISQTVEIQPLPLPYFSTNAAAFNCAPFKVFIQNTTQYADKYYWYVDGTLVSTERIPSDLVIDAPNRTVTLMLVAENALGCQVSTQQQIQFYPRAEAGFNVLPNDVIKIPDYTFDFQNTSTGTPTSYLWNFGDGSTSTQQNPSHTYKEIGVYPVRLIVNNLEGCPDTLTRNVEIQTVPGYLYVPNVFEPGSQTPELKVFKPKGSGIAEYRIRVFNKYGMLLWESTQLDENGSPLEAWDGTQNGQLLPQDVYVWTIEATFINRSVWKGMKYEDSDKPSTTGSIMLIR